MQRGGWHLSAKVVFLDIVDPTEFGEARYAVFGRVVQ